MYIRLFWILRRQYLGWARLHACTRSTPASPAWWSLFLASHFFWLVVTATTVGLLLSAHSGARRLEGVGASRLGSAMLYVLVASIGMKMNLMAIFENTGLFVVGLIWRMYF